jgi:NADH:ubiquinone oxidoreductase subunit 4 (subunit M)
MIFAIAIFAGEIPLNALVFQIFGENQIMTWVMAAIIGLSVPLAAHFIGIKFREESEGYRFGNIFKGILAFGTIVAALYGLSVMRQTYLSEFREELGLTEMLVETSFMFFWLNIAVLAAAIMIAYLSHDPAPGYQEAKAELQRAS